MSESPNKRARGCGRRGAALISVRNDTLSRTLPKHNPREEEMRRTLLLLLAALLTGACVQQPTQNSAPAASPVGGGGDAAFKTIHDKYVVEFLRRNPTVNTYLGGAGLDPSLKDVDGRLRDHSPSALAEEDRWLADSQKAFQGVDPA